MLWWQIAATLMQPADRSRDDGTIEVAVTTLEAYKPHFKCGLPCYGASGHANHAVG